MPAVPGTPVSEDAGRRETGLTKSARPRSWGEYLDLNSGDLEGPVRYADGIQRYEIYESPLSKEVRRLGIPIPQERNWQRISPQYSSYGVQFKLMYPDVLTAAYHLLELLGRANAPDEERRAVLERFMASIRTGSPRFVVEKAHVLIVEFADQHGLECPFRGEYGEHLRRWRQ